MFKNLNFINSIKISNFKFQILLGLLVYLFIGLLVIFPKQVSAQQIALGIYPPIIQITAKAPSDIQSPLTIKNESDSTVTVHIGIRPFTQSQTDDGKPFYLPQGESVGNDPQIYQKMSLFDGTKNTDSITLAPSQTKNLELRIHLPSGEPAGDYYFSIVFISNSIATDHDSGTAVAGGISTNVLLSIGPKDATNGYIKQFSAPFFVESGPVPFTVHVANTSGHFINPQAGIVIKNMYGQTIGKVTLKQDTVILANTARFLTDDQVNITHASLAHPATWWNEKFLLGFYSATLTIAFSGEGPLYRQTIYFFALPIQILIGIILGIILVCIIIYRVKRRL